MIKNVKLAELKAQSVTAFLNTQTDDLIENKCLRRDKKKKKKNDNVVKKKKKKKKID